MKETSAFFILFVLLIASYGADTSHLVVLASKHFKNSTKERSIDGKEAKIPYRGKDASAVRADHPSETLKPVNNRFFDKSLVRLKDVPRTDVVHNMGNSLRKMRKHYIGKHNQRIRFFRNGTITLASRQPATLYRNGEVVLHIKDAQGGYTFTHEMKIYYGDLLAVESRRSSERYGIAVDVRLKVKSNNGRRVTYVHYSTQNKIDSRTWRGDGILRKGWKTEKRKYCRLPRTAPVRENRLPKPTMKNPPPLSPDTRYVWVSGRKTSREPQGLVVVPKTAYLLIEVGTRCSLGHEYERVRPRKPPHRLHPPQSPRGGREGRGRQENGAGKRGTPPWRAGTRPPHRSSGNRRAPRRTEASAAPNRTRPHKTSEASEPPPRRTRARTTPPSGSGPQRRTESRRPPRQRSKAPMMENNDTSKPNTAQENDAYPPLCKCRAFARNKKSVCYRMLPHKGPYGRCRRRKCGLSYQCVLGGGRGLKICLRRVARYEVVLTDKSKGVLRCHYRKLRKPKVYYSLYE